MVVSSTAVELPVVPTLKARYSPKYGFHSVHCKQKILRQIIISTGPSVQKHILKGQGYCSVVDESLAFIGFGFDLQKHKHTKCTLDSDSSMWVLEV